MFVTIGLFCHLQCCLVLVKFLQSSSPNNSTNLFGKNVLKGRTNVSMQGSDTNLKERSRFDKKCSCRQSNTQAGGHLRFSTLNKSPKLADFFPTFSLVVRFCCASTLRHLQHTVCSDLRLALELAPSDSRSFTQPLKADQVHPFDRAYPDSFFEKRPLPKESLQGGLRRHAIANDAKFPLRCLGPESAASAQQGRLSLPCVASHEVRCGVKLYARGAQGFAQSAATGKTTTLVKAPANAPRYMHV